jgi:hypothetical protein
MKTSDLTNLTLDPTIKVGTTWMPVRTITDLTTSTLQNSIAVLQQQVTTPITVGEAPGPGSTTPAVPVGTPRNVTNVTATESVYKNGNGQMQSLVSVSYTPPLADAYFAGVQIWLTNYRGSSTPQLVAQGNQSPVSFPTDTTNEIVVVTVVSVGKNGSTADFSKSPTTTVTLNGVTSPPPAPSIAQGVVAIGSGLGWQFTWNVLNGLLNDVIAGYWVYYNTTNSSSTAVRLKYVPQPPTNIGTMNYQDLTTETRYYWVTSVNSSGLESTRASANTTTVVVSYYPIATAIGSTYVDPTKGYDGNETTSCQGELDTVARTYTALDGIQTYQGFNQPPSSGIVVTDIKLKVMTDASLKNSSYAYLYYSLDSGSTWTYQDGVDCSNPVNDGNDYPADNYNSMAKQYSTVTLPLTQDLSHVYVRGSISAESYQLWVIPSDFAEPGMGPGGPGRIGYPVEYTAYAIQNIYECRVDVTYQVVS